MVDGSVRGMAAVGFVEPGPMPAETEARISRFAELMSLIRITREMPIHANFNRIHREE
jgi:hypothetical protein